MSNHNGKITCTNPERIKEVQTLIQGLQRLVKKKKERKTLNEEVKMFSSLLNNMLLRLFSY